MGLKFEYPEGATPLDPDDAAELIPSHITTHGQLNAWELRNVVEGEQWVFGRTRKDFLSIDFMQTLHRRMFGDTWKWAGRIRKKESMPGIAPENIEIELKKLCLDVASQLEHRSSPLDEIAARFHHRLVWIHPFPNGNGRFSRTMTDLLLVQNGGKRFTWGADDLIADGVARERYISALRAADAKDHTPLLEFVRSSK